MKINYAEKFKELVESIGYELLSKYKNATTKVKLECDKGHEYEVRPSDFKTGYRCPICSGKCPIQAKEQFMELLKQENCELLSEYKNVATKVKIRCSKYHIWNVTPNNFKNGSRCPKCASKCPIQAKEQFLELLEKEGYELLNEYKNVTTKVELRCKNGHEYKVIPNSFNMGSRCPKCSGNCPIQAKKEFLELLIKEKYELLSEYKSSKIKVKLKCNYGHEYSVTPNSFKTGYRCPKCSNKCPIQAKEQFIELLDQEGYKLLNEYKNNYTKVELKCKNGHEWGVKPGNFKNNYCRCPHCEGSTGQRLLQSMLEEYNIGKVIYNDREILDGLELDIYYPEFSIGIEYQGNYWHSLSENIERDERKRKLCKEKGIRLIEVWDDDFLRDKEGTLQHTRYKIKLLSELTNHL